MENNDSTRQQEQQLATQQRQQQEQRTAEQRQQAERQQQEQRTAEQRQQAERQQQERRTAEQRQQADRLWQQRIADQARQNQQTAGERPALQNQQDAQLEQRLAMSSNPEQRQEQHGQSTEPRRQPSEIYSAYRENGMLRGAEHTRNPGRNGEEAINNREQEHMARQERLEAMAANKNLPANQRERAELQKNAEEHSYRYEQLQRVVESDKQRGFDHHAQNGGAGTAITDRMNMHQEAAEQAVAKLHEFDMKNQLVDSTGSPVAKSERASTGTRDHEHGQREAIEALNSASEKLNQQPPAPEPKKTQVHDNEHTPTR